MIRASAAVMAMLRGLKMHGMAHTASDLIEQGAPAFDGAVPILSQLLKAEVAEREVPVHRPPDQGSPVPRLQGSDRVRLRASEVNEAMDRQLHRGERGWTYPSTQVTVPAAFASRGLLVRLLE